MEVSNQSIYFPLLSFHPLWLGVVQPVNFIYGSNKSVSKGFVFHRIVCKKKKEIPSRNNYTKNVTDNECNSLTS